MAQTTVFDQAAAREWLQQAVKVSGLSPGGLARKAGVSPTTLTRFIYGRATHLPSSRTLSKVAAAADVPLFGESGQRLLREALLEVPPDQPRAGLFLSFVDLVGRIIQLQGTVITGRAAHREVTEFDAILAEIAELQNRLYATILDEGIDLRDVLRAVLRNEVIAPPRPEPNIAGREENDPPPEPEPPRQRGRTRSAAA